MDVDGRSSCASGMEESIRKSEDTKQKGKANKRSASQKHSPLEQQRPDVWRRAVPPTLTQDNPVQGPFIFAGNLSCPQSSHLDSELPCSVLSHYNMVYVPSSGGFVFCKECRWIVPASCLEHHLSAKHNTVTEGDHSRKSNPRKQWAAAAAHIISTHSMIAEQSVESLTEELPRELDHPLPLPLVPGPPNKWHYCKAYICHYCPHSCPPASPASGKPDYNIKRHLREHHDLKKARFVNAWCQRVQIHGLKGTGPFWTFLVPDPSLIEDEPADIPCAPFVDVFDDVPIPENTVSKWLDILGWPQYVRDTGVEWVQLQCLVQYPGNSQWSPSVTSQNLEKGLALIHKEMGSYVSDVMQKLKKRHSLVLSALTPS